MSIDREPHDSPSRRAERLVAGVVQRLPELAYLASHRWPSLYWCLRELLQRFERETDITERDRLAEEIAQAVTETIPMIRESWLLKNVADPDSPGEAHRGSLPAFLSDLLGQFLEPAELHCDLELNTPQQVGIGFRKEVTLTFRSHDSSVESGESAIVKEGIRIRIHCRGFGVEIDEPDALLSLNRKDLPQTLRLGISGQRPGVGSIVLDLWQGRDLLAVLEAQIEVVVAQPADEASRARIVVHVGGETAPEPELCIRVRSHETEFDISMDFYNSEGHVTCGRLQLRQPAQGYWQTLRNELEELSKSGRSTTRELDRIGQRLYQRFWPHELQAALWSVIDSGACSVRIDTDEPWIPWELLQPYRDLREHTAVSDGGRKFRFLCEHFDLARWYQPSGGTRPRPRLEIEHLGLIVPAGHGLPAIDKEAEMLRQLAAKRGIRLTTLEPADREATLKAMSEERPPAVSLWHFAGHGNLDFHAPDRSPLQMEDRMLRPDDLPGDIEHAWRRSRPTVFLNACRVGHGGQGLTEMGGWASQMVGQCGAGAFVAPLWAVSDDSAFAFAKTFYELLSSRSEGRPGTTKTIAHAVRLARDIVRKALPDDTTWLAYSLFAHPNASITTAAAEM